MSSHHIIREDQEPALVIDNAQSANYESIQQLLEWSPTVIVTERALEQVLLWGIKIDVVIAITDNFENLKTSLHDQMPFTILSCNDEHEAIETALHFLTASKQKAVNIITDSVFETFEKFSVLDVAVIKAGRRWIFIRSGHFKKWFPSGQTVSIRHDYKIQDIVTGQDGPVTIDREGPFWISEG